MIYFALILVAISYILLDISFSKYRYFKGYVCEFAENEPYRKRAEREWFRAVVSATFALLSSLFFLLVCPI